MNEMTTLSVSRSDAERFQKLAIQHQAAVGRRLSLIEFFAVVLDEYEGGKKHGAIRKA